MTLRIGQIPYLNSVLFYHTLAETAPGHTPVTLEPLVPRELSSAAVEDGVDCGPVPLVTCWEIEDRYEPLVEGGRGDFCIATPGRAHSILLFSKKRFEALDGATIGVTGETSTSVRLMKTLFAQCWRVTPERYTHLDWPNNDAFLLIGDEALIHRNGVKEYPHVADLGEVWSDWLKLPFVFARWVVRRDLASELKRELIERVEASLEEGWQNFEKVVDAKARELSMSVDEMRAYLDDFHFHMTPEARESMSRFRQLDGASQADDPAATAQQGGV